MTNQLIDLLNQWYEQKDQTQWVLGIVFKTEGPCYRKKGAMMLFGGEGQQLGMLSGGCLESDIQKHARRVMDSGQSVTIRYDGTDEDDLSFQLGIGCGGTVHILLQTVNATNNYQQLDQILNALKQRQYVQYQVNVIDGCDSNQNQLVLTTKNKSNTTLEENDSQITLTIAIKPQPHLLVVGGGVDARPLVAMAAQIGWTVTLWDPRPANARREYFLAANQIIRQPLEQITEHVQQHQVNAAVLMSHNLTLDSQALKALAQVNNENLEYIAMLGPANRRRDVFELAKLNEQVFDHLTIAGPAGLALGGDLPESIALSILAECHAKLHQSHGYQSDGRSLSGVLQDSTNVLDTVSTTD